tara:strand:+ start:1375 stop:2871 length:1497 start_codon:yes stop_codon:yes gene_type:complete
MEQIVKYQRLQSGALTATQNLCDFLIPEGGTINLKKSFINVNMSIQSADVSTNAAAGGVGIYNSHATFSDGGSVSKYVPPIVLVKNAAMSSQKKGLIESIKRVDVLRSSLYQYEKDESEKVDQCFRSLNAPMDENQFACSPFRDLNSVGTEKSKEVAHDVRIDLSDIFGIAQVADAFSTDAAGQIRIHTELNIDKLGIGQLAANTDGIWTDDTNSKGAMDGVAAAAALTTDLTVLNTTKLYTHQESLKHPFFVGQKLAVTFDFTPNGGPLATKTATVRITGIAHNTTTKKMNLTLDRAYETRTNTNDVIADVTVKGVNHDAANSAITVNSAEIVVVYNENPPLNKIEYLTYTTEEDSGGNAGSLNKQYQLEPSCVGLIIAMPSTNSSLSSNNYTSYRLMVNNEHQTDRKIEKSSPLEYDRRSRWFQNHAKAIGSLKEQSRDFSIPIESGNTNQQYTHNNNCIMEVMPQTEAPKNLGVELVSGANIGDIIFFKEVIKSI